MVEDKGYEKVAHLYDLFDTKNSFNFFYQYAKETGVILDIGAGTGRIAIYLAERGIDIVCIEPSPAMRNEFLKKLRKRHKLEKYITLIPGDAQNFKVNEIFKAAFLSGSFDHIPNKQRVEAFQNINRHLYLEGKLIFDVYIEGMQDSELSLVNSIKKGNHEYKRFIGTKVLPDKTIDVLLIYETYKQRKLIEKIEQQSAAYTTTRTEVHALLKGTGFSIENEFGDYSFSPFKEGDSLLVIEARKIK